MAFPADQPIHVFKFGGTSVASGERIQRVIDLVRSEPDAARKVVVVSALGGVTDHLITMIQQALARTGEHRRTLQRIRQRHEEALGILVRAEEQEKLLAELDDRFRELGELLDGVYLLRECTLRTRDAIIGMGERVSAPLVAAGFRTAGMDAVALDPTALIRTDGSFGEANVLFEETNAMIQRTFEKVPVRQIVVVPGFIAQTDRGVRTTLGRSGSDYTATVIAGALHAERVTIWTDVDGVLSADPRLVPDAFPLPQLSYREAAELAYFGAKVLHPRTMRPLQERGIPLLIKNTLNPAAPGTLITHETTPDEGQVKAITTIRGVAVVMLEGKGMIGVPGIAARVFGALAAEHINVLMISQASSEQSICTVVPEADGEEAVRLLHAAFELELRRGDINNIEAQPECAVVSAVGDHILMRPGLAGQMFSTLGRSGVNVLAIAQGASETNISAVVRDSDVRQAVRALHEAFALERDRAHLFLIGTGVIGKTVLNMLTEQAPVLLDQLKLNLQLVGLANTRQMVWDVEGIPFGEALSRLDAAPGPRDLDTIVDHLVHSRLERLIVIDATASDEVALRYPELLEHSIAVITPNKRANTQGQPFYDRLHRASRRHKVPYFYETTVGAGLPIISTLRDLLRSGDKVHKIEGVFSGTLAFIFSSLSEGHKFSDTVRTARKEGYTEPDPRDDLKGEDVARKLLILAREKGLCVERSDVAVESLVPTELLDVSVQEFMDRLEEADDEWEARIAEARAQGHKLQYIGLIEEGRLSVRVRQVGIDSPFYHLRGSDNMVVFTTQRYHKNPLVVQGPGAGPVVTAAGILADLIKAAELVS
ncbi:MAG TPA: bifunctional aspartate kinase/homoserine dehydrogenase I [Rhodothermales bacterium]|nr:bifunctional aspartate kinase/homoserine dehydrogenase I [Rhodothermales bacterium]